MSLDCDMLHFTEMKWARRTKWAHNNSPVRNAEKDVTPNSVTRTDGSVTKLFWSKSQNFGSKIAIYYIKV